jgi:hypothetical protein
MVPEVRLELAQAEARGILSPLGRDCGDTQGTIKILLNPYVTALDPLL